MRVVYLLFLVWWTVDLIFYPTALIVVLIGGYFPTVMIWNQNTYENIKIINSYIDERNKEITVMQNRFAGMTGEN